MHLKIITPRKVVFEQEIEALTAPGSEGELTVLPSHAPLFTMLDEGLVRIQTVEGEEFYSIGGGYLETDGKTLNLLVSRAYGQDELDEAEVKKAQEDARKLVEESSEGHEREAAMQALRRSMFDEKLIQILQRKKKVV